MRIFLFVILTALFMQPLAGARASAESGAPTDGGTVHVDFNQPLGEVNRAIFSLQGFMQAYVEPNPMVMESFKVLNPQGTQTRLEIWPHLMEPNNDDEDPNHMNWAAMRPQQMIRFIDDFDAFMRVVEDELGMEPLALITYNNAEWMKSGNPESPVADHEEWAEFAAAVIETFNGRERDSYRTRLRLAQIWNEPNMPDFYGGSMESYFDLFNTTADRLHANYPGVIVGGPNISHAWHAEPAEWMAGFLEHCGSNADYIVFHHYGPQGEGTEPLINHIRDRAEKFRAIPGREKGKVMITETDAWFDGWPKMQFVMERQFRFLDVSDLLLGIHHFCVMAYNESGNYTFGTIDEQGGVVEGVFWPYWIFRNLIGDHAKVTASNANLIDATASRHMAGEQFLGSAILRNMTDQPLQVTVDLHFPAVASERVLQIDRINENFQGIGEVHRIAANSESISIPIRFSAAESVAVNVVEPGKRHFAFHDLNNQEQPWLSVEADKGAIQLGGSVVIRAELHNTLLDRAKGIIRLGGMPEDWTVERIGDEESLDAAFGEKAEARFRITANSLPRKNMAGIYAWLDKGDGEKMPGRIAHSIPVSVEIINPVVSHVMPSPVHAIAGEENQVDVQLESQYAEEIDARIELQLPEQLAVKGESHQTIRLKPGERTRVHLPFGVPTGAEQTGYDGNIRVHYAGHLEKHPVRITVSKRAAVTAVPINLSSHFNFDALAYLKNREDVTKEMGMFLYPADYTPLGRRISIYGIPYELPPSDDGANNAVALRGQTIEFVLQACAQLSLLGFGHDGSHPISITLNYADGSSESIATEIPQWCTPAPAGARVAFTAPFRYTPGGVSGPACEWFAWEIPVNSEKQLKSVTLPNEKAAYLFSVTAVR